MELEFLELNCSEIFFSRIYDETLTDGTPYRCTASRYGLARDKCRGCLTFLARREIYGQSSVSRPGECAGKKKDERKGTRATGAPNAAKLITAVHMYTPIKRDRARSILSAADLASRTYLIANENSSIRIASIGNLPR